MASGTRQRVEHPGCRNWEDVDATLREIGELTMEIEGREAELTKQVNELKAGTETAVKPLLDRKELLELRVREFAAVRRGDFGATKSMVLNFGTVGFRQSTKIVLRAAAKAMAALKARGMLDCIITKESVNKEALRQYDDAVLKAVGASRKPEDVFWYEVNRERVAAAPDAP